LVIHESEEGQAGTLLGSDAVHVFEPVAGAVATALESILSAWASCTQVRMIDTESHRADVSRILAAIEASGQESMCMSENA